MSIFQSPKAPEPTPAPSYADTLKQQKDIADFKNKSFSIFSQDQSKLGAQQLKANGTGLRIL